MQGHVHRADPQHGRVEVEAVEQLGVEALAQPVVAEQDPVMLAKKLAGRHQEAAGAGGWIADGVLRGPAWSARP